MSSGNRHQIPIRELKLSAMINDQQNMHSSFENIVPILFPFQFSSPMAIQGWRAISPAFWLINLPSMLCSPVPAADLLLPQSNNLFLTWPCSLGHRLNVTEGTVKVHLHKIYQKLGVRNRAALSALAMASRALLRSERG